MSATRYLIANWRHATRANAAGIGLEFSVGHNGITRLKIDLHDARALHETIEAELERYHVERRGLGALVALRPQEPATAAAGKIIDVDDDDPPSALIKFLFWTAAIAVAICALGALLSALVHRS